MMTVMILGAILLASFMRSLPAGPGITRSASIIFALFRLKNPRAASPDSATSTLYPTSTNQSRSDSLTIFSSSTTRMIAFFPIHGLQIYRKRCSPVDLASDFNFPFMPLNNPVHNGQSQADTFAFFFGREEWGEQFAQVFSRNANPRIRDIAPNGILERFTDSDVFGKRCGY